MSVYQVAKFKLGAGVTEEQFLAVEAKMRAGRIRQQAGFEGREVGKDATGAWFVIMRWSDEAAAKAWTPIFMQDPDGQQFASMLDFPSMRQELFAISKL